MPVIAKKQKKVLQDGFIRVFTYIHTYKGQGSFEGWIRKIVVNAALLKFRNKSQLRAIVEYNAEEHDIQESDSVVEMLEAKELIKLVQTLSPGYRMVFNLYVLEGMKHREIAELLGISRVLQIKPCGRPINITKGVNSEKKGSWSLNYLAYE